LRRLVDLAAFLNDCKNVAEDLTWMFVIGQRVDRRNAGKLGELLDALWA